MSKINVVYGAPCSGKTTYVRKHFTKGDLVWDYDSVRQALILEEPHSKGTDKQNLAINILRDAYAKASVDSEVETIWFICTKPTERLKKIFGENANYIRMDTSKEECLDRLEKDDTRPDKEFMRKLIDDYFGEDKRMKTVEEKISEGRQYRNLDTSNLTLRQDEDGKEYVEGYASTFNEPYTLLSEEGYTVREMIAPTAFDNCDMSDVIMQYNHQGRVFARTSNGTLEVKTDEKGLYIRAYLGGTELGKQIYEEIRGGYTSKMSFGFHVRKADRTVTKGEESTDILRTVTDISKLYDVSAVSVPANDATVISARNLYDGVVREIEEENLKRKKLQLKLKMRATE